MAYTTFNDGDGHPTPALARRIGRNIPDVVAGLGLVALTWSLATVIFQNDEPPKTIPAFSPFVLNEPYGSLDGVAAAFKPVEGSVTPVPSREFAHAQPWPFSLNITPEELVTQQAAIPQANDTSLEAAPPQDSRQASRTEPTNRTEESVPLPPPNPFRPLASARRNERVADVPKRVSAPAQVASAAQPKPDDRSFFEKLFNGAGSSAQPKSGQALAYARTDEGAGNFPSYNNPAVPPVVAPSASGGTAVYDIAAHVVYMPDGTRLEAHSGLGSRLDDTNFVHVKMQGATPPHTYDLTLREKLFHGVQAIRLNPVDGRNQFGRTGLLAHTYMLGPNGDSNGCVSFKDYQPFLNAFMRGEVKRLVVVPHSGSTIASQSRART